MSLSVLTALRTRSISELIVIGIACALFNRPFRCLPVDVKSSVSSSSAPDSSSLASAADAAGSGAAFRACLRIVTGTTSAPDSSSASAADAADIRGLFPRGSDAEGLRVPWAPVPSPARVGSPSCARQMLVTRKSHRRKPPTVPSRLRCMPCIDDDANTEPGPDDGVGAMKKVPVCDREVAGGAVE
jgi:hypothetical protein